MGGKVKNNWSVFLLIGHGPYDNSGKMTRKLRQVTNMYNSGNGEADD